MIHPSCNADCWTAIEVAVSKNLDAVSLFANEVTRRADPNPTFHDTLNPMVNAAGTVNTALKFLRRVLIADFYGNAGAAASQSN